MHMAACEISEEPLERQWPEVAEDESHAFLRSRTKKEMGKNVRE